MYSRSESNGTSSHDAQEDPVTVAAQALERAGLTVGVAESCTGGLLGGAITEVSGSSEYFVGGVIAYDNAVKEKLLAVPGPLIEEHGAVSAPVAGAMAEGIRERLGTSLGIAVTGVAGPSGGSPTKPV